MTVETVPQPADRKRLRLAGLILVCSTPISGLLSYAVVAIAIGESRLEGPAGLTALGWAATVVPAVIGLALVVASFFDVRAPGGTMIQVGAAALAVTFLTLGVWSMFTTPAGDASIGGGLLILFAIPLIVVAVRAGRAPASGDPARG